MVNGAKFLNTEHKEFNCYIQELLLGYCIVKQNKRRVKLTLFIKWQLLRKNVTRPYIG